MGHPIDPGVDHGPDLQVDHQIGREVDHVLDLQVDQEVVLDHDRDLRHRGQGHPDLTVVHLDRGQGREVLQGQDLDPLLVLEEEAIQDLGTKVTERLSERYYRFTGTSEQPCGNVSFSKNKTSKLSENFQHAISDRLV